MQEPRPIAATRTRRGDSFRSIQSLTSEGSTSYSTSTPRHAPPTPLQAGFGHHYPAPDVRPRGYEIPTAVLDLNFDILRANRSFEMIMAGGRSLQRSHLAEIVVPADDTSFQMIKNRLRAEREAREPTYMAPILQPGQDTLQGISDAEAEHLAQRYHDQTYTWSQTQIGVRGHTFPARVRLAKASIYFVVVTLPSFRPVEDPWPSPSQVVAQYGAPFAVGPPIQFTPREELGVSRQVPSQPGPPVQRYSYPVAGRAYEHTSFPGSPPTYPFPTQSRLPSSTEQHSPTAHSGPYLRLQRPILESVMEHPNPEPRPGPRDIMEPVGTAPPVLQIPPMVESPNPGSSTAPPSRPATGARDEAWSQPDSDDEDGQGGTKRIRRMGIDDVLQR